MNGNGGKTTINDRIWITSRVRMISEKRALRNNFWSLLLLTYYALVTVILSVFSEYYGSIYGHFSSMVTAASVVVLVASLVVSGFRFEKAASLYRDCYLSLQKLAGQSIPDGEKEDHYNEILSLYPNQSSGDYHDFLVSHILLEGKRVWNGEEIIAYTNFMLLSFAIRKFALIIFIAFAILAPIIFLFNPVVSGATNAVAPAL